MDGVIIDSEPYYRRFYELQFEKLGILVSEKEKDSFVGCSTRKVWTNLKEKYNLAQGIDELINIEIKGMYEYIQTIDNLTSIEGIPLLLKVLKENGIEASIASSSNRKFIEYIVEKLLIKQYFHFIISGDDIENGKPAPDIFIKVAEHFGSSKEDCTVIEDSTNGLVAAKAAGMKCIGFINSHSSNQDISKADLIIDKFSIQNIQKIMRFLDRKSCF